MGASAEDWHLDNNQEQDPFVLWEKQFAEPIRAKVWRWLTETFATLPPSVYLQRGGMIVAGPQGTFAFVTVYKPKGGEQR